MPNQYNITINTHLLSHISTFCFSLYFLPIVAFTFILLTCNNTIRSVLLKEEKTNETRSISSTKKELSICPTNKQKANSLTVFSVSFERMNFASTERWLFGKLCRLISFTKQRKNKIPSKFPCFPWRGSKSLLKYDSFWPPMTSSSFSLNF